MTSKVRSRIQPQRETHERPTHQQGTTIAEPTSTADVLRRVGEPAARPSHQEALRIQRTLGNRQSEMLLSRYVQRTPQTSAQIQRRSPNPKPAPETGKAFPKQSETAGTGNYAEHHVVPHQLLEKFWKAAAKNDSSKLIATAGAFMGNWSTVTVGELIAANILKEEWLAKEAVTEILDQEVSALKTQAADTVFSDPVLTRLKQSSDREVKRIGLTVDSTKEQWAEAKARGDEGHEPNGDIDEGDLINLVSGYYEWMPGNLVVGPEGSIRANDPKEKYDTEAANALASGHRALLESIYAGMTAVINEGKKARIAGVMADLKTLGSTYNTKTVVPANRWRWTDRGYELTGG